MTVSRSFVAIWENLHTKSGCIVLPFFTYQAILILQDGAVINGFMQNTFELAEAERMEKIEKYST